MNKEDLEKDLIILGVNPRNYTLASYPYKDSSWVLKQRGFFKKKWSVFHFERGKRYDEKLFNTEDEACIYIYEKLKNVKRYLMNVN